MSNYTILTNFAAKDTLPSGNPGKIIKGTDFTNEFLAIQTAIASKADGTVVFFPDGSATQPSVGFTNNAGTGVYNNAGVLSFATNATLRASIPVAGGLVLAAPTSGSSLAITGAASANVVSITYTSANANPLIFTDTTNTRSTIIGPGVGGTAANGFGIYDNTASVLRMGISANGNVVFGAPSSGGAVSITGVAGHSNFPLTVQGAGTAGNNNGPLILAGLNSSDNAFVVNDSTNAKNFFVVLGDGQVTIGDASASNPNFRVGFLGTPQNAQGGSYTLVATDKGKMVQFSTNGSTCTIPSGVFGVGDVIEISAFFGGGSGSITLAQGAGLSLYWSGAGAATLGSRTLASVGQAVVTYLASNVAIISGNAALT